MDSLCKLDKTELPVKEKFYSKLNDKGITDEEYTHSKHVWNELDMKTMRNYHYLFMITDVLILADVFENFRKICMENYKLDPARCYTSPGLSWDALLKMTKVKLELSNDPDMVLMFEKGIRGGVSMISKRYTKANNPYMGEEYDSDKPTKYITYLDANNLYGWAMSKPLPVNDFKWLNEKELEYSKEIPYVLEVDLEYLKELHDLHNDYPLAPKKLKIDEWKKLFQILTIKKALKLFAKTNYNKCTIFSENLIVVHMKKTKIKFNKPIYTGMSVLDLSKTLMYDFHYNYIEPKYGSHVKLLITDTDSLEYEIETEDFYKDISLDVETMFDTSNYPKNHESGIPTGKDKKVIGMFKDECGGKQTKEFVGLRAKLYSNLTYEGNEEKKCKGVKKNVIKNNITHEDYINCLFTEKIVEKDMNIIRHKKHDIYTERITKIALSANDDKRIILEDKINTLAYGHYKTLNNKVSQYGKGVHQT